MHSTTHAPSSRFSQCTSLTSLFNRCSLHKVLQSQSTLEKPLCSRSTTVLIGASQQHSGLRLQQLDVGPAFSHRSADATFRLCSSYLDSLEQEPEPDLKAQLPRLAPWQSFRLEQAFQKGKKHYQVKQLAGDLNLHRTEVLLWLKLRFSDPSLAPPKKDKPMPRKTSQPAQSKEPFTESGGTRPVYRHWQVRYGDRRLNREAKDTLERVFSLNHYPTDEMIDGIVDITRLPRKRIIEWFKDARKDEYEKRQAQRYEHDNHRLSERSDGYDY